MTNLEAIREADRIYGQIYRIRQSTFVASHIGLGTWGKYGPLSAAQQERIRLLQRERSRYLRIARQVAS